MANENRTGGAARRGFAEDPPSAAVSKARAALYQALAEALAEPPEWLAWSGREWPLVEAVAGCAPFSPATAQAAASLAGIPAEGQAARRARYAALFAGPGEPRFWLYESAVLSGRLLGPQTWAVERLYRAAGLEAASAELPDHASLELAYLGHLAQRAEAAAERAFLAQHAGKWLPQLGRALAASGDPVYGPIGGLLAGWLDERSGAAPHQPRKRLERAPTARLPALPQADGCTLCGFCVQACPARALAVRETAAVTELVLDAARCNGCGKCQRVCYTGVLRVVAAPAGPPPAPRALRQSPRPACRACGAPLVSQAELDFVAHQLGAHPAWLDCCAECRISALEVKS